MVGIIRVVVLLTIISIASSGFFPQGKFGNESVRIPEEQGLENARCDWEVGSARGAGHIHVASPVDGNASCIAAGSGSL